jgi:hypothetical protein
METTGVLLFDFAGGSSLLVGRPRWLVVLAGWSSSLVCRPCWLVVLAGVSSSLVCCLRCFGSPSSSEMVSEIKAKSVSLHIYKYTRYKRKGIEVVLKK